MEPEVRTRVYDEAIDAMYHSRTGYLEPLDALIMYREQMGDDAAAVKKWMTVGTDAGSTFDEYGFDMWWGRAVTTYMHALKNLTRTIPELRGLYVELDKQAHETFPLFFKIYA